MKVLKHKGAHPYYTPGREPNFFDFLSERQRMMRMPASTRQHHRNPAVGAVGELRPPGSKLLKGFHKSGLRKLHASKPQYPCYGRRSER